MRNTPCGLWTLVLLAVTGCGGSVDADGSAGSGGQAGSAGTAGSPPLGGAGGSGGSTGGTSGDGGVGGYVGPTPSECAVLAEAISAKLDPAVGACTAVVRVGYADEKISGYRIICGAYGKLDEATAFKMALNDTGVGNACFGSSSITGATPEDDFVFFQAPSAAACACCGDGWVTAVSARAGSTLLGGTITFGGSSGLVFPAAWDPPSDLGKNCGISSPLPPAKGFDLTLVDSPTGTPPPLDPQTVEKVVGVVWNTTLPLGISKKQYVFDAIVLRYRPLVGTEDGAEWVVLLNSGWLE